MASLGVNIRGLSGEGAASLEADAGPSLPSIRGAMMPATAKIRVTGGRVLTCEDRSVLERGSVVVEGDRIAWVGPQADLPAHYAGPDYQVIDATGKSVMPGLVDGHMHISFGEAASEEELSLYTPAEYRAIRASVDAEKALLAGVTSSCDPGGPY